MKYSKEIKREMKGKPRKVHPFRLKEETKEDIKEFCAISFPTFLFIAAIFHYIGLF